MKIHRPRKLGFILTGVGLLLAAGGISKLKRPDLFRAKARIALVLPDCGCLITKNEPEHSCGLVSNIAIQVKAIQAEAVLSNVVVRLDLSSVWGNKYNKGQKLRIAEAIALMRNHVDVRLVSNTTLVDICTTSEDPAEAALIANAVAEAYRDWQNDRSRRMMEAGIAELAKQNEKLNQQIKNSESELERLRQSLNISPPEPEIGILKTNFPAYAEAKRNLAELKDFERLLARKFKIEQEDLLLPVYSRHIIFECALPDSTPSNRPRRLGAMLMVAGMTAFGFGVGLMLTSRATTRHMV